MNESYTRYSSSLQPSEVMRTVRQEGACAVENFVPEHHLRRAARVLAYEEMIVDRAPDGSSVERHHGLSRYSYSHEQPWTPSIAGIQLPPEPIWTAARAIDQFVNDGMSDWQPNEIIGHRYEVGDFIGKHRDYASALGYVAVLTVDGMQEFSFERDDGEIKTIPMHPGTLTIMRGYDTTHPQPRPYHWVSPATERRLAISLRQMRQTWE